MGAEAGAPAASETDGGDGEVRDTLTCGRGGVSSPVNEAKSVLAPVRTGTPV